MSSCHGKSNQSPWICMAHMIPEMNLFFLSALAPTTQSTYRSGLRAYRMFCGQMGLPMFPLRRFNLQLFITAFALQKESFFILKVYLSGIQYESRILGFKHNISAMPKLYYVLRGIKRTQGSKWGRRKCKPIIYFSSSSY